MKLVPPPPPAVLHPLKSSAPAQSILNPARAYTPSTSTDVASTFARHGFVPPSTLRKQK